MSAASVSAISRPPILATHVSARHTCDCKDIQSKSQSVVQFDTTMHEAHNLLLLTAVF
jgi:hypothetical protein